MGKSIDWLKLLGEWVVLVLECELASVTTSTEGDEWRINLFEASPTAARVVGVEDAGVWVNLLEELEAVKRGEMRVEDFGCHFVPFGRIESARIRGLVPEDYQPEGI